jgi:hypothetical protein
MTLVRCHPSKGLTLARRGRAGDGVTGFDEEAELSISIFLMERVALAVGVIGSDDAVESSKSILLERTARAVVGGETGANLGAAGVTAKSFMCFAGVETTVENGSSKSVITSSSSVTCAFFSRAATCSGVGKRRRGLSDERVRGPRRRAGTVASSSGLSEGPTAAASASSVSSN